MVEGRILKRRDACVKTSKDGSLREPLSQSPSCKARILTTELLLGWENSNLQRLAWEDMGGRAEERCWRERPKSGEAQNVAEFILRHKNT